MFGYIEMLYNLNRKRTNNGMLSPIDDDAKALKLNETGA